MLGYVYILKGSFGKEEIFSSYNKAISKVREIEIEFNLIDFKDTGFNNKTDEVILWRSYVNKKHLIIKKIKVK